jgi:hypothetical protein
MLNAVVLLLFILFHIIYKYGIFFNIKFNLNIIVLGYEWENKRKSEKQHTNEREIKIKHKRHFFGLLLFERTQKRLVVFKCGCGFYSIFDCIIVQLETPGKI